MRVVCRRESEVNAANNRAGFSSIRVNFWAGHKQWTCPDFRSASRVERGRLSNSQPSFKHFTVPLRDCNRSCLR